MALTKTNNSVSRYVERDLRIHLLNETVEALKASRRLTGALQASYEVTELNNASVYSGAVSALIQSMLEKDEQENAGVSIDAVAAGVSEAFSKFLVTVSYIQRQALVDHEQESMVQHLKEQANEAKMDRLLATTAGGPTC